MERLPPAKFQPDRFARLKGLGVFLLAASFFAAAVLFLSRLSGHGPSGGGSLETSPVTLNGETEQNRAAAVALIPSTSPSSIAIVKPSVSPALIAAAQLDVHAPLGDPLTIAKSIPNVDLRLVDWLRAQDTSPATRPQGGDQWTVDQVCAALTWRESRLCQSSLKFHETMRISGASGPESYFQSMTFDLKWKNNKIWYIVSRVEPQYPALNYDHSTQSWDGAIFKALVPRQSQSGKKWLEGTVNDLPPGWLTEARFFTVIGMRMGHISKPWSQFIREEMAGRLAQATTSLVTKDGQRTVILTLFPFGKSDLFYEFDFLPDKDFAQNYEQLQVPNAKGPANIYGFQVHDLNQFDGFWMSTNVTYSTRTAEGGCHIDCNLDSFSLKPPTDAEMEVVFPAGTRVMDSVHLKAYTVLPDGNRKYREFLDSDTGQLIRPATEPTTEPSTAP